MLSEMKRATFAIILFILNAFAINASGKESREFKRFTFGAEWGYAASFHSGIHHNFFSEEGYRVDMVQDSFTYKGNGDVYVHLGYNLTNCLNLSLYAGIAGISDFHKAVPISLRLTRYMNIAASKDRWLLFADAGSGVCIKPDPQSILTGKIGGGYSITLSRDTSIDLLFAYRMTLTHPEIVYDGHTIGMNKINRNNAYVSALSLSISLNF